MNWNGKRRGCTTQGKLPWLTFDLHVIPARPEIVNVSNEASTRASAHSLESSVLYLLWAVDPLTSMRLILRRSESLSTFQHGLDLECNRKQFQIVSRPLISYVLFRQKIVR